MSNPHGNTLFRITKVSFFFIFLLLLAACNPTKKLKEGEYLVEKNIIVDKKSGLDKEEIESYIRQKPNRKLFRLFYFHTWLYDLVDPVKSMKKKEKRNEKWKKKNKKREERANSRNKRRDKKRDAKNRSRMAKGKKPLPYKRRIVAKKKNLDEPNFGERIQNIGEAPVVLDTFLTNASVQQIKKYFLNNGFFNVRVNDSIVYEQKKKRAQIFYIIRPGDPYRVRNITYKVEDPLLAGFILADTSAAKIKVGMRYQGDLLAQERERIYKQQINNGYYEFAQDFIYFLVDTNLNMHKLDLTIGVKNFGYKEDAGGKDTILFRDHIRYYIRNIYAITDFNPFKKTDYNDTTIYETETTRIHFLHNQRMQFRSTMLAHLISVTPGSLYSYSSAEETYRRLSELRAFKNINVVYNPVPGTTNQLDMVIQMSPVMKQAVTAETEGTNTAGNFGIAGSLIYQNRNTFRGAELMEIRLRGGLTAQKSFGAQEESFDPIQADRFFNTIQFGPEFNLYFPRAFFPWPFSKIKFKPTAAPKTILTSSGNYQKRPEFGRTIINFSYGYQWKLGEYNRFNITPFEANVIDVSSISPLFQQALDASNDFFLKNSFRSHITNVTRITYFFNNQNKPKAKDLFYFRATFESAGNVLRPLFKYVLKADTNSQGSYTIAGTPFAQFIRFEGDFRYYKLIRKTTRLVLRLYGGVGYPYINMSVLPYEKGFFAGGPNSVRAWKARTLGPGAFTPQNGNIVIDKIGDNQLEANVEYRFLIYKILNGAFFVDAGNVFLRKQDTNKPEAEIKWNNFYKNVGIGTGFGLRADFSFFIIRLDASFRIHDPALPAGDRWTFDKKPIRQTVINFGIGYPF